MASSASDDLLPAAGQRSVATLSLSRLAIGIALVALYATAVGIKIHSSSQLPEYDPVDGDNFYWTESAFHFRHARMVSEGRPIPTVDTGIQAPEGLDTRRYVTPLMERVYGRLHRWFFAQTPLHAFLVCATALVSSLSIFACFGAGCSLTGARWPGLMCAGLYGLSLAAVGRNTGAFIREDFALPWLFGSFACLLACLRRDRWPLAALGAALLLVALAAWHVSQFFYLLLIGGLAVLAVLYPPEKLPRRAIAVYAATVAVAALALPVLRAKFYIVSVPVLVSAALVAVLWLRPSSGGLSSRARRTASTVAWLAAAALVAVGAQAATGAHSHVFSLLWAKLRFAGTMPADPTALSFEAKAMWTSSFLSPTPRELWLLPGATWIFAGLGLVGLVASARGRGVTPAQTLVLLLVVATVALFLMVQRLAVFTVFFVALSACWAWPRRLALRTVVVVLLLAALVVDIGKYRYLALKPTRPLVAPIRDVTDFLRSRTDPDAAVLAPFQFGPTFAAYADRPVLLHPKFESKGLRDKIHEVYTAWFQSEQAFFDVCSRHRARYVVYHIDVGFNGGPESIRYQVGLTSLPVASAAFAFHFAPRRLRHFQLVHQNHVYRVFRVGREGDEPPATFSFEPIYDLPLFVNGMPREVLTDEQIRDGRARLKQSRALVGEVASLMEKKEFQPAMIKLVEALNVYPRQPRILYGMAEALAAGDLFEQAADMLMQALELDPQRTPELDDNAPVGILTASAIVRARQGDLEGAEALCRRVLALDPESWRGHFYLGSSLLPRRDRLDDAEAAFLASLRLRPDNAETYERLAQIYVGRKEYPRAIEAMESSLRIKPDQPRLGTVLERVRAVMKAEGATP